MNVEKIKNYLISGNVELLEGELLLAGKGQDQNTLNSLLHLFSDDYDFDLLFLILHTVESFEDKIYVHSVLKNIEFMFLYSHDWTDRIINRIFNSPSCRDIFIKNIQMADRKALTELLDYMEIESPHHLGLINEIRNLVN